jgi:hypothetical protein
MLHAVVEGAAEEARTRGFPSPSFGGLGFIGSTEERSYAHNKIERIGINTYHARLMTTQSVPYLNKIGLVRSQY